MRRLLVTGFGPFPRVPDNPSAQLAKGLAADPRWRRRGVDAQALVLDTAYSSVADALLPAIRAFSPDAVLMLGVAARRRRVTPEFRALNRASRLYPDVSGAVAAGSLRLEKDAPLVRRTHAPVSLMVDRLRARGLAAAVSRDAGRYLCNAAYFAALGESERGRSFACAFVHVPLPGKGRPLTNRRSGARTPSRVSHLDIFDCATLLLCSIVDIPGNSATLTRIPRRRRLH
ncbi:MAG: peptidase C15 [Salinarimonadaceae bacterium]|nr:MAG: peptidase C15 [Salinarimonadaceae bacterium]